MCDIIRYYLYLHVVRGGNTAHAVAKRDILITGDMESGGHLAMAMAYTYPMSG